MVLHTLDAYCIVGAYAGDMIGEADNVGALAIEIGADAADIGKTIRPDLTLGESVS